MRSGKLWSSVDIGLVFSGKISNEPFARVLMHWRHSKSTNARSLEMSEVDVILIIVE